MSIPNDIYKSISQIIVETLTQGDQVAFPSFGNFSTEKIDEHIVIDENTNSKTLVPPSIVASFTPAIKLIKELSK